MTCGPKRKRGFRGEHGRVNHFANPAPAETMLVPHHPVFRGQVDERSPRRNEKGVLVGGSEFPTVFVGRRAPFAACDPRAYSVEGKKIVYNGVVHPSVRRSVGRTAGRGAAHARPGRTGSTESCIRVTTGGGCGSYHSGRGRAHFRLDVMEIFYE